MKRPILLAEGVVKRYRTFAAPAERVKRLLRLPARYLDFHALDGVTLSLQPGTALGIIGENGAGKSTLLKIISGTTAPTRGTVRVEGVVASILELGAAFHPEFTGRQNAVLYGAMLGLSRGQMERKLPAIVEFAELGEFMDHPIKSYSTGMVMRLGFAVATHVDADILVIDEALAVGDGYFQKKCVDRLLAIKEKGVTILFCSHAMYYVSMFCDRAVWLKGGKVEQEGPAKDVVEAYERYLLQRGKRRLDDEAAQEQQGEGKALKVGRIVRAHAWMEPGSASEGSGHPDRLMVDLVVESARLDEPYHVGVSLDTLDGRCILAAATFLDGRPPLCGHRQYRVGLEVSSLSLSGGTFSLYVYLLDENGLHVHDEVIIPEAVRVDRERWLPSLLEVPHSWSVVGHEDATSA